MLDRFVVPQLAPLDEPLKLELIGEIPSDPAVREAVQKRRLLMAALPGSAAAQAVTQIAQKLSR